jgi:hypothetical protein
MYGLKKSCKRKYDGRRHSLKREFAGFSFLAAWSREEAPSAMIFPALYQDKAAAGGKHGKEKPHLVEALAG